MTRRTATTPRTRVLAAALALPLLLAGCSGTAQSDPTTPQGATAPAEADTAPPLRIDDPWVKATEGLGTEGAPTDFAVMTGAFGTLTNLTDEDLHIASVTTPLTGRAELHETVMVDGAMTMQQMKDGFTIPAGQALVLEPGGNHLMLMELTAPIKAGEQVEIALLDDAGDALISFAATARTYAGANEEYADHE